MPKFSLTPFLQGLSLRQRFLIAPMVGAALLLGGASILVVDVHHRNTLLDQVVNHDLARYDADATLMGRLTRDHLALLNAQRKDADARHLAARAVLDDLATMAHRPASLAGMGTMAGAVGATGERALPTGLSPAIRAYQDLVGRMGTGQASSPNGGTAVTPAPADLGVLNERFNAVVGAYAPLLQAQRSTLRNTLAQQMVHGSSSRTAVLAMGVLATLLLAGLAWFLARLLSEDLNAQILALDALREPTDGVPGSGRSHEIGRIAAAIATFRRAQGQLKKKEQVLALTNEALVTTLEQLDATRGDLERRVDERTEELRVINGDLIAEVERRRVVEQDLLIYAEAIRSTGEAVVITDGQGRILEVNPAYEAVVGIDATAIVGQRMFNVETDGTSKAEARSGLEDLPGRDDGVASHESVWHGLTIAGHWSGETQAQRHDGSFFPCLVHANAVAQHHEDVERFVFVLRDITRLKQSEQQLTHLAFHDPLTALPNRALFNARLNAAVAHTRAGAGAIAVLYLDLDRFKDVNDTLGHPAGDELLKEVARRLAGCIRSTDTLARMGGDEFTVLLAAPCTRLAAEVVAQRIIAAVSRPIDLHGTVVSVGASIGISVYDGTDHWTITGSLDGSGVSVGLIAEALQKHADLALYDAKGRGRGQHRFFTPELLERSDRRLSLSVQIDHAIKEQAFVLHYQPIVNVITGVTQSVEALIRWRNARGEWISPGTFIPHAEEAGFIKRIDTWVLGQACQDAMAWVSAGRNLAVSVNLSAVSVQQADMVEVVAQTLKRTGLPARYLSIEITETAVISDPGAARAVLDGIAALGVSLSFDDFGTGYSSLSYLTQFPIRCIKLDRTFIERIGQDEVDDEVVRSILDMARRLNLRVIAEGVEDEAQQNFLLDAGCDLIQGFFIGRPMPGEHLHSWLQDRYACAPLWEAGEGDGTLNVTEATILAAPDQGQRRPEVSPALLPGPDERAGSGATGTLG